MNSCVILSVFVIACVFCIEAAAEATGKSPDAKWTCRGEEPMMDEVNRLIGDCYKNFTGEADKNVLGMKITICIWEHYGLVKDNVFSEENFKASYGKTFPKNGPALSEYILEVCVKSQPKNVENLSKDNDYSSYKPVYECTTGKMHEWCGTENRVAST